MHPTRMKNHFLSSLLMLALFLYADAGDPNECVYTLYVKTGSIIKGGTDSKISVTLEDAKNQSVRVPNLKAWGAEPQGHDYFQRGNIDAFTGRGPCIGSPICRLNLTSDGSGSHHGWFCDTVEVTSTGHHKPCAQTTFFVNRWLAEDVVPFTLTAVLDGCRLDRRRHSFIVGRPSASAAQY